MRVFTLLCGLAILGMALAAPADTDLEEDTESDTPVYNEEEAERLIAQYILEEARKDPAKYSGMTNAITDLVGGGGEGGNGGGLTTAQAVAGAGLIAKGVITGAAILKGVVIAKGVGAAALIGAGIAGIAGSGLLASSGKGGALGGGLDGKVKVFFTSGGSSHQIYDSGSAGSSGFDDGLYTYVIIDDWTPSGGSGYNGWTSDAGSRISGRFQGDANILNVNWMGYNDNSYFTTAGNVVAAGEELADILTIIRKSKGLDSSKVSIIAFGLGGHVAGAAGHKYGGIGRITALDLAGISFRGIGVDGRLDFGDADFVDVYHTDDNSYGFSGRHGHVDVIINEGIDQPGARSASSSLLVDLRNGGVSSIGGSHFRIIDYYLESLSSTVDFAVYGAASYDVFLLGNSFNDKKSFGLNMDRAARGYYYSQTRASAPYMSNAYLLVSAITSSSSSSGKVYIRMTETSGNGYASDTEMKRSGSGSSRLGATFVLKSGGSSTDYSYSALYRESSGSDNTIVINSVTISDASTGEKHSHCQSFTLDDRKSRSCSNGCPYHFQLDHDGDC